MSKDVNINLLYCLGNQTVDDLRKDYIRLVIIKQIICDEKFLSSFVKIYNSFLNSFDFKKEVMADLIIIYMALTECIIDLDDDICKDIVDCASIETLGYYSDMIVYNKLKTLCICKYWDYVFEFYDFALHDKDDSKCLRKMVVNDYRKDDK